MTPERSSPWATVRRSFLILGPLLLLALFLSAFFWQVTLKHEVISAGDLIYISYPWQTDRPPGYSAPENIFQPEDAFLGYPSRFVLFEALKDGGLFNWQPFHLSGTRTSFPTDFLGYAFYPPAWFYFVLPFHIANSVFLISVLFVAGLGMYLLLAQLRLPRLAAVYGALLFMLNGHFIVWLGSPGLPAILGLIPLMIFGFERYHERRQPPYLLIPAACLAMQIYLGYAPGWVVTGGFLTIYGLVRLAPTVWRRRYATSLRQTGVYAASAGLGLLLAAYALIPTLSVTLGSSYQSERRAGLIENPLENAWTYIFPNYWGSPEVPNWFAPGGGYPEWIAYFGITAAPLALLGLWQLRRSWVAWFAVGVLAFSLSQMYGIPPLKSLSFLPGLQQTTASRWHFGVPLAVSLLAPLGMAFLLRTDAPARTRQLLGAAIAAALVVALVAVAFLGTNRGDTAMWLFISEGRGLVVDPADFLDQLSGWFTHLHRQLLLLLGGGALTILALLVRQRWTLLLPPALVVITFIDLFGFGSTYNATVERRYLYPDTPGLAYMQSDDDQFRIAPVIGGGKLALLPGYTGNIYGLETITGYDHFRDPEYLQFLSPMLSQYDNDFINAWAFVTVASGDRPLNHNLLTILNVKYVVTHPSGSLYADSAQVESNTPFPIYGTLRQGQALTLHQQRVDTIEFQMATGGGPGPRSPVIFHLKRALGDPVDIYTFTVDSKYVPDNGWVTIQVPPEQSSVGDRLFVEIEAPKATAERPLYVWGVRSPGPPGSQRLESGAAADGSLTFRVLYKPSEPWLTLVYQGDDLAIYKVDSFLPRAWGVGRVEILPSREAAMTRAASDDFDPTTAVVLAAEDVPAGLTSNGSAQGSFDTRIIDYDSDAITVATDFSQPGFLVLSERFDDGWQAEVDGADVPVLRAYGLLRAIPVDAGQHTVKLSFQPWEYVWGFRISLITTAMIGLGVALYYGRSVRKRFGLSAANDAQGGSEPLDRRG